MTNNTKIALESLSMDLKRVALGYHRGSINMAKRFSEEALKRSSEVNLQEVKPYIKTLLKKMTQNLKSSDAEQIAENTLMYSTLFQNYCQKNI